MERNKYGFHCGIVKNSKRLRLNLGYRRLSVKSCAHIPVKPTYKGSKLAELYITRIVCLHGVPKKIVSDRGTQSTSKFWEKLHESMDMKLNFNLVYHPQTDGQTERVNHILEDMLRACTLNDNQSWISVFRMLNSPTIIVIKKV
jgi:transposase InsO family protein